MGICVGNARPVDHPASPGSKTRREKGGLAGLPPAAGDEAPDEGFEDLFGREILTKEGLKATSEVLGGKKAVLVYFSAHWCSPCRGFTPVLARANESHSEGDVAVVFVSADKTEGEFEQYFGMMPWYALPFSARKFKAKLNVMYGVSGIPTLLVLDGNGKKIRDNGSAQVQETKSLAKALGAWNI